MYTKKDYNSNKFKILTAQANEERRTKFKKRQNRRNIKLAD